MRRWVAMVGLGLAVGLVGAQEWAGKRDEVKLSHVEYQEAELHEVAPHRRSIPVEGELSGFDQLALTLTVSATGEVVKAEANGESEAMKLWPAVEGEVEHWRFTPFEKDGKAVVAVVQEYVDLVPPERLPKVHVKAPEVRPDSKVAITLQRTGCFGTCPGYKVTAGTDGLVFEGGYFLVASGRHTAPVDADAVRALAKRFVAADFYSLDGEYVAGVTDNPTYVSTIEIDGKSKKVVDYVGASVGMPGVVTELEEAIDKLAETDRWIKGTDGLVELLKAEKYDFASYEAQVMLKGAAANGEAATVSEMLAAGVPLKPLPAPKQKTEYGRPMAEHMGWLTAGSQEPEVVQLLIDAGASKDDQADKDLALNAAARSGKIRSVKALLTYGANANADLAKAAASGPPANGLSSNAGSILISASMSGNPEVVREILKYRPDLETRDWRTRTAVYAAGSTGYKSSDGARPECVRLLASAGADISARDKDGNTPLHVTYLLDVQEELLKLGADVNARNNDGETPIFTVYNEEAMLLFLEHGADLKIRNKKGQTVVEAAEEKGPLRVKALKEAIREMGEKR